jgi:hypothetical protein
MSDSSRQTVLTSEEREMLVGLDKRELFREVNERIRDVMREFAVPSEHFAVLCECGREDCRMRLRLPLSRYEQVRSHARLFVVSPGHEEPGRDEVITGNSSFRIVATREEHAEAITDVQATSYSWASVVSAA